MKKWMKILLGIIIFIVLLIVSLIIGSMVVSWLPTWALILTLIILFIKDEYKNNKEKKMKSLLKYPEGTEWELTKKHKETEAGTIVRKMADGGYETQNDGNYTYFWWDEVEDKPNWKLIEK